ncbi:MAG: hypothetical protein GF331_12705 [Chitinivibrionales bacterium]|nr:hypothetical protein [Chitinivibrionales bacterium]
MIRIVPLAVLCGIVWGSVYAADEPSGGPAETPGAADTVTTLASDSAIAQSDAAEPDEALDTSLEYSELDGVRSEARHLRRDADDLREMARRLESDARRLERKARDLTLQANQTEAAIHAMEVSTHVGQRLLEDSTGEVGEEFVDERKELIVKQRDMVDKLHSAADTLVQKAHAITMKMQEMEEEAEEREDMAEELEEKAEELDRRPLNERYPLAFGYQNHYTTVGPYDDNDAHILRMSGLFVQYAFKPYLTIGVRDAMLHIENSLEGMRFAISAAPVVATSYFVVRRIELEAGLGAIVQGQTGADGDNDAMVAPFLSLASSFWVGSHFTFGPVTRLGYVAMGNMCAGAVPFDKASVLPTRTFWFDLGLGMGFHF